LFFEGSEKKVEIVIKSTSLSLIDDINDDFWHSLVQKAGAQILSCITSSECKAFILSESSLFIWHNRFILLTCGVTNLVDSVQYFFDKQGRDSVDYLIYQRKNEYYSYAQPSCFIDDVDTLNKYITGKALRFGDMDSHHTFLFYTLPDKVFNQLPKSEPEKLINKSSVTKAKGVSYEFQAYHISQSVTNIFTKQNITTDEIRVFLQLNTLLPDFTIDDHIFNPYGYSVNAIKEDKYFTIHITPQKESSFVSIESNINLIELSPIIIEMFEPKAFDVLCFNDKNFKSLLTQYINKNYLTKTLVEQKLAHGGYAYFASYVLPQTEFTHATPLNLQTS